MLGAEERMTKLAVVTGVLLVAAAEAFAQERRIVVSIPDRKLAVVESGQVLLTFDAAVGKPHSPSPSGSFKVVQRIPNPTWYTKGRVVPPGKGNPLGTRWMGISSPGVGIHGTDEPASIGYSQSHGCVRMLVPDAEWLFDHVTVGTPVFIVPA